MEDYHSWFNILAFIIIVLINATVFGFGTSIKNIGESDLERDMEEGDKKAARLLRVINRPTKFVNTVQLISVLFSYIIGDLILDSCEDEYKIPVYVLALLVHLSFGIVIPKYLQGICFVCISCCKLFYVYFFTGGLDNKHDIAFGIKNILCKFLYGNR